MPGCVARTCLVDSADNVIVRNLTFENAADCFPQWDPTDGADGNWNSQYDNISLVGATHVWVDHCAFSDGTMPDRDEAMYYGRPYQVHDGALDITRGGQISSPSRGTASRTTTRRCSLARTDNPANDAGKLRVTLHHNLFDGVGQRVPRVRFGQVHVYNNFYHINSASGYTYSWGIGVQAKIYAEQNAFAVASERCRARAD